jgi:hypothetical protein
MGTRADDVTVEDTAVPGKRRKNPLIYFWVYSLLRIALMAALFGLLWLFGLGGLLGAAVAVALSVPLSYVLLARPRNAMTAAMMERLNVRQERNASFDEQVAGPDSDDEGGSDTPPRQP